MKIECVVICVNYSDFLAHTLPFNKQVFDNMVVVTNENDRETPKVCEYYNVRCHRTSAFYENGDVFNKGKGINEGLRQLSRSDWLVHMDADIVLPPLTRQYLEIKHLDCEAIYGMDRLMCETYRDWAKFLGKPELQHELDVYVHPRPFPLGVRIAKREYGGYVPIGYFQMWHGKMGRNHYPTEHEDAARSDMLFALQWPIEKRHLIPELFCYHLATEDYSAQGAMGINWAGRKTALFGPTIPIPKSLQPAKPGYADPRRVM